MINIKDIINDIKTGVVVVEVLPGVFQATSINSKYIIEYDRNKCIGAASCAAIAPLTFFMNEDGIAEINTGVEGDKIDISPASKHSPNHSFDSDEVILQGAQSCPVLAIKIIEKDTGKVVFPVEIE